MSAVSDRTPTPGVLRRPARPNLRDPLRRLAKRWREAEIPVGPARADWQLPLRRTYGIGLVVLLLELIGFGVWSQIEVNRFALSADFAAYLQGAFLFGHGHIDPQATSYFMAQIDGAPRSVWGNAGEFFMVPLGVLYRIWPHVVLLKWIQDLALIAAQAIAFTWMAKLIAARREGSTRSGVWLLVVGLILLVANPWFLWASSFDIHSEPFAVPFVVATAHDLYYGRRRVWIWAACGMACSAVGISYVVAVCVSMALTGRARARTAVRVAGLGLLWFIGLKVAGLLNLVGPLTFKTVLNGGAGSAYGDAYVVNGIKHYVVGPNGNITLLGPKQDVVTYGKLLHAIINHPFNVVKALWVNHANMWGTISAAGLLGVFWLPITVLVLDVLFQGGFVRGFSLPSFQNVVLGGLIAVGTVALLIMLARRAGPRRQWVVAVIGTFLALNTVAWGAIWFPKVSSQWLDISSQAASEIGRISKLVRPGDEVVASQGIVGAFGARQWAYSLNTLPDTVEVAHNRRVWFMVAPYEGVETLDPEDSLAVISELSRQPGVHFVSQRDGIWLFEWNPPRGAKRFTLSRTKDEASPAWALAGASGRPVQSGPKSRWYVTNTGKPGYVLARSYWREPAGIWLVRLRISAAAPTNVEIWNATTSTLLKRVVLTNTHGIRQLELRVPLATTGVQPVINGFGPWSIAPILRGGYSLELRVWTAGRAGTVNVYSTSIEAAS